MLTQKDIDTILEEINSGKIQERINRGNDLVSESIHISKGFVEIEDLLAIYYYAGQEISKSTDLFTVNVILKSALLAAYTAGRNSMVQPGKVNYEMDSTPK